MTESVEQLVGYVPAFVQRWLAASPDDARRFGGEHRQGAVLFADITGFTPLAHRLAQRGPEGAEQLDAVLNAFYSPLVDLIAAHGGDVACYAGDAAIAYFPASEASGDNASARSDSLASAVQRAAILGLDLQQRLRNFRAPEDVQLSIKIGIGAGALAVGRIGGVEGHWRPLLVGAPLVQIGQAAAHLTPGDVVLTGEARRAARGDACALEGETLPGESLRLRRLTTDTIPSPLETPTLNSGALDALRCYVPQTVLARFDAGHARWLSDLRQLSVLFVKLDGIDASHSDALHRLHEVMQTLQRIMQRYEGEVLHLIQDDKGIVAVLCLGLPPSIHEDDADRAVGAALRIKRRLREHGVATNIGLATGRIFSGPRGNERRREYSITGLVANLAARLMGRAQDDVLCDEPTAHASRGRATFAPLPPIALKGIELAVPAYQAIAVAARIAPQQNALVGREKEIERLTGLLDSTRSDQRRVLWVEGEPGVGKSALLAELRRLAKTRGARVFSGEGDAIERATPYFPWRGVFSELFQLAATESTAQARERVLNGLEFDASLVEFAPLLNAVLPLELPETAAARDLDARARADNLHDFLIRLLNHQAETQSVVVVLDDAHWVDSASRRLLVLVVERCPRVAVAIGSRPSDVAETAEHAEIMRRDDAERLLLDVLPRESATDLCTRKLKTQRLSDRLADFLYQRSQGNPFYIDELTRYLRDVKLVVERDGCCDLKAAADEKEAVPTSIRALITHRVDRLPLPEQLTLRTATVIGRSFPQRTLIDVYQDDQHRDDLDDHLTRFTRRRLIELEAPEPELAYAFRHVTIQQVTYDQMPLANRRQLHHRIGAWYERYYGRAANYFPLLAHHFGRAGDVEQEIAYLVKSGENALRNFANREAVQAFEAALAREIGRHAEAPTLEQARRLGHWRRQLGEAQFQLGNLHAAQSELEAALDLFRRPPARGVWPVRRSIVWQIVRQTTHLLLPGLLTRSHLVAEDESAAGGHQETALALQRLSQIHYLKVDILEGLERAMRALNVAERAGQSPLLAKAYAGMGLVVGMLRRRRLAERYARLSEQTARQTGSRPTLAYVLMATGVYRLGVGSWEQVARQAKESIAIAEQLGDRQQLADCLTVDAMHKCFVGEYQSARQIYQQVGAVARTSGNELHKAWGHSGEGECLLRLGDFAEARSHLERALNMLADKEHRTEEIRLNGMLALVHLRQGDRKSAEQFAEATMRLIEEASYTTVSTLEGYSGAIEVLLELWRTSSDDPTRRHAVERACKKLAWYAKVFPVGWARYSCLDGVRNSVLGRGRRAASLWRRALRQATRLQLPLESAQAHWRLAQSEASSATSRIDHLRSAERLFDQIGAAYELQQVHAALAEHETARET